MTHKDSEKIREIYRIYEQPMYRIAFAVLNSPERAEDAVSEAFLRIIRKIGRIGEPDSEKTKRYIVSIIKSTAIDQYRKYKHFYEKNTEINEEVVQIADKNINVEEQVFGNQPNPLLNELNETDQRIINLRCCEDLSWREVAKRLSLTESNVRKRFERARKKIIQSKGECCDE